MKFFKYLFLSIVLSVDLLIVAALLVVTYYLSLIVALIFLCLINCVHKDFGGWFSAWKLENIKKFLVNWDKIMESK